MNTVSKIDSWEGWKFLFGNLNKTSVNGPLALFHNSYSDWKSDLTVLIKILADENEENFGYLVQCFAVAPHPSSADQANNLSQRFGVKIISPLLALSPPQKAHRLSLLRAILEFSALEKPSVISKTLSTSAKLLNQG